MNLHIGEERSDELESQTLGQPSDTRRQVGLFNDMSQRAMNCCEPICRQLMRPSSTRLPWLSVQKQSG